MYYYWDQLILNSKILLLAQLLLTESMDMAETSKEHYLCQNIEVIVMFTFYMISDIKSW